jgi:Na+/melibiose symporter-like transporter
LFHINHELKITGLMFSAGTFPQKAGWAIGGSIAGPVRSRYNIHEKYPGFSDEIQNLYSDANAQDKVEQMRSLLHAFQADKPHVFGEFGGGQR